MRAKRGSSQCRDGAQPSRPADKPRSPSLSRGFSSLSVVSQLGKRVNLKHNSRHLFAELRYSPGQIGNDHPRWSQSVWSIPTIPLPFLEVGVDRAGVDFPVAGRSGRRPNAHVTLRKRGGGAPQYEKEPFQIEAGRARSHAAPPIAPSHLPRDSTLATFSRRRRCRSAPLNSAAR